MLSGSDIVLGNFIFISNKNFNLKGFSDRVLTPVNDQPLNSSYGQDYIQSKQEGIHH